MSLGVDCSLYPEGHEPAYSKMQEVLMDTVKEAEVQCISYETHHLS